jgi:DNA-binding GntR family transcriptional regulator
MATEKACQEADRPAIDKIRQINVLVKKAIVERALEDAFLYNRDFHFAIYEASSMQVALPLIDTLWLQAAPFLCLSLVKHGARWSAAYHDVAMEAFDDQDPTAARRAIERDIEETLVYLLEHGAFAN